MSIAVKNEALRRYESDIKKLSQKIAAIENNLQTIKESLDYDIKCERNINGEFKKVCEDVDKNERNLNNIASFLSDVAKSYEDAEKKIKSDLDKISQKKSGGNVVTDTFSKLKSIGNKAEAILKVIIGMGVFGSPIGSIIVLGQIKKYYEQKGITLNNEEIMPVEVKNPDIPELSEILSYDPSKCKEEVLLLQKKLNESGVIKEKLVVDGLFGKKTLAAVNEYKEHYGLWNFGEYEGKVGKTTWDHLFTHDEATLVFDEKMNSSVTVDKENHIQDAISKRKKIVDEAVYWVGKIPYCLDSVVLGQRVLDKNNPPPYMDCADFTSSIYKTVLGIDIGLNTSAQIKVGEHVEYDNIEPGDLIIFDWDSDGETDHVGIYIGDGKFVHESGSNKNPNAISKTKTTQNVKIGTLIEVKKSISDIRRIIQDDDIHSISKEKISESVSGIDIHNQTRIKEYKVKGGDTLSKIAKEFGMSVKELAEFNGILNINLINVGQVIRIPVQSALDNKEKESIDVSDKNDYIPKVDVGEIIGLKGTYTTIPTGYKSYISALKTEHPNWEFYFYDVAASDGSSTFESFVKKQFSDITGGRKTGYNTSNNSKYWWYDENGNPSAVLDGKNYRRVSEDAIRKLGDPRYYMNENLIWAFKLDGFDPNIQTLEGVKQMFKGSVLLPYAEEFYNAAKSGNMDPYTLASKSKNETGAGTYPLVNKGNGYILKANTKYTVKINGKTVTRYTPDYDVTVFNFGAIGCNDGKDAIFKGAIYALDPNNDGKYDDAWTDSNKAIKGMVKVCSNNYINRGQDTLYSMKFNVADGQFYHQYQTNIEAPSTSECNSIRNRLSDEAEHKIIFKIPVFSDFK